MFHNDDLVDLPFDVETERALIFLSTLGISDSTDSGLGAVVVDGLIFFGFRGAK